MDPQPHLSRLSVGAELFGAGGVLAHLNENSESRSSIQALLRLIREREAAGQSVTLSFLIHGASLQVYVDGQPGGELQLVATGDLLAYAGPAARDTVESLLAGICSLSMVPESAFVAATETISPVEAKPSPAQQPGRKKKSRPNRRSRQRRKKRGQGGPGQSQSPKKREEG